MMIKITYTLLLITLLSAITTAQSNIIYDVGSSIDIGTGADVCADVITINGTYSGSGSICNGALPVILSSFTAEVVKNEVILKWITESEINNSGFEVEKNYNGGSWVKIAFVQGNGTISTQSKYLFTDKKLQSGNYFYRIKQIDYNGNYEYYTLNSPVEIQKPKIFSLSQNYPNPSNPGSKINFELPEDSHVIIKIYDIIGRELSVLLNGDKLAGYYTVEFNGKDLASGIYFYRLTANSTSGNYSKILKLILIK